MMMPRPRALLPVIFLANVVSGCVFFEGNDNKCYSEDTGDERARNDRLDPSNGVCRFFDNGACSDSCAPCDDNGQPVPDWAPCESACDDLPVGTCMATPGCRAIYVGGDFYDCWAVAPSGPIHGGGCEGLDAYNCSRHDDCVASHLDGTIDYPPFASCAAEVGASGPGSCVGEISCREVEPVCPSGTIAGRRYGCWTGFCIAYAECDTLPPCDTLGEAACISRMDCSPTYAGNNCTCNGQVCTCQSWTFDSCKTN